MSILRANTPSSTTGSTAGSPPATLPPPTPLSPNSNSHMVLPTSIDIDNNNNNNTANSPVVNGNGAQGNASAPKRKASRRANTAERRATHNAVERQRRETLNGRFLDLAALLPNLATVRRPSKSAIVNSSIALLHSNRRQRLIAARELRLLKDEADRLRLEINEWRDRSGLPRVDEPARAPEFLNLLALSEGDGAEGEGWWDGQGSLDEMGEEERKAYELVMGASQEEDGEDGVDQGGDEDEYGRGAGMMKHQHHGHPGALAAPASVNLQHILPRGVPPSQQQQHAHAAAAARNLHNNQMPAIASPTTMGFDPGHLAGHPALHGGVNTLYEPNGHPHPHSHSLPVHPNFGMGSADSDVEKIANWNSQLYAMNGGAQHHPAQPQWAHQLPPSHAQHTQGHPPQTHALFTPPGTAGSTSSNGGGGGADSNPAYANAHTQAFLAGLQQQRLQLAALGHGHVYASPEGDDASSVGSVDGNGNMHARSAGGSPQPQTHFDANGYQQRRPSLTLNVPGQHGQGQWNSPSPGQQPISAGGGGGGGGPRYLATAMGILM